MSALTTVSVSLPSTFASITYRVRRSTRVAIWLFRLPNSKSPSQWPGTARSSTVAGRSLIETASTIFPWMSVFCV
jgi:hypothetical protein